MRSKQEYALEVFQELFPRFEPELTAKKEELLKYFREEYVDGFGENYWARAGENLVFSYLMGQLLPDNPKTLFFRLRSDLVNIQSYAYNNDTNGVAETVCLALDTLTLLETTLQQKGN